MEDQSIAQCIKALADLRCTHATEPATLTYKLIHRGPNTSAPPRAPSDGSVRDSSALEMAVMVLRHLVLRQKTHDHPRAGGEEDELVAG
jgi:hypothetical protein